MRIKEGKRLEIPVVELNFFAKAVGVIRLAAGKDPPVFKAKLRGFSGVFIVIAQDRDRRQTVRIPEALRFVIINRRVEPFVQRVGNHGLAVGDGNIRADRALRNSFGKTGREEEVLRAGAGFPDERRCISRKLRAVFLFTGISGALLRSSDPPVSRQQKGSRRHSKEQPKRRMSL